MCRPGEAPGADLRIVPLFETIEDLRQSASIMTTYFDAPLARAMIARHYNRALASHENKAEVNWSVIARQFQALMAHAQAGESVHAVIDRQGGRKFYVGKISAMFPGSMPWVEAESPHESIYRIEYDGRVIRVSFLV